MDQPFTPRFLGFETLPSTNTEAIRLAQEGAAEGTCVTAREQTAGRGRQDRVWTSPRDAGLYLSVILRPQLPAEQWPMLTLMTAVAVHQALVEATGLTADIKWPNDLTVGGRKISGILAETVESPSGRAAVIGIGVNLRKEAVPPALDALATSVEAEAGPIAQLDANEFAVNLVASLAKWYALAQQPRGASGIIAAWSERSSYTRGKTVWVISGDERFTGVTDGLSDHGALRVITENGATRLLHSAEISAVRPQSPDDKS